MDSTPRRVLFAMFLLSGFSSLTYQMVWTRMAFASFGIITPVLSVVLSVFMLGLAIGSWAGGRGVTRACRRLGCSPLLLYAAAELIVGAGAFLVPRLFAVGRHVLLTSGESDSGGYLMLSALVIAAAILPWSVAMGTTFPFAMAYVRDREQTSAQSFSFLYLANVLGAMSGTFLTAMVFIELLGFERTLWVAAAFNAGIACAGVWLASRRGRVVRRLDAAVGAGTASPVIPQKKTVRRQGQSHVAAPSGAIGRRAQQGVLFTTGFVAMATEVMWTRAFTPVLKTQVYSFALVVVTYLAATTAGSWLYRRHLARGRTWSIAMLVGLAAAAAFVPIVADDARVLKSDWLYTIDLTSAVLLLVSICPFSAVLGYLTPMVIDVYSGGEPAAAGEAYAINVTGCILGPLVASYALLPWVSEPVSLILMGAILAALYVVVSRTQAARPRGFTAAAVVALASFAVFVSEDFQDNVAAHASSAEVRRDYAASVMSADVQNNKLLLVNGLGMTLLSPVTKIMVHLPLALHHGPAKSVLVICFGMGTSYRAALSWGVDTTVVELVPSVARAFGFYHADAPEVLLNPQGRVVIDDGRRFLARTDEKFDLIVVDPPPPPEAAGSSLLYSEEFTRLAMQHLRPHGILQTWFAGPEFMVFQAVLRSVHNTFPYVRTFGSIQGWGIHVLASMDPIDQTSADQAVRAMPLAAEHDLMEWSPAEEPAKYLSAILSREIPLEKSLNEDPRIEITDDRPLNEYFLLRRMGLAAY